MTGRVSKKLKVTNLTMPNNMFSIKFALISVPGLAANGGEDGSSWPLISKAMKQTAKSGQKGTSRQILNQIRQEMTEIAQKGCQGLCLAFHVNKLSADKI